MPETAIHRDALDALSFLEKCQEVIRLLHGCLATHLRTETIHEEALRDQLHWSGLVEIFAIIHPEASRCYVWRERTEDPEGQFTVVLSVPPVVNAEAAVKFVLAQRRLRLPSKRGK